MKNKKRIESIRVERVVDQDPDTSYLGEFTDSAEDSAIIRIGEHKGKRVADLKDGEELPERGREYRFFVPAMSGEETGNPDSPTQDWQRMESLNDGQWCFVGVIAKAVVVSENGVCQTLRSGGLWGIESDSGEAYFKEVAGDELAALRSELESFGFGSRAITYAINRATFTNE